MKTLILLEVAQTQTHQILPRIYRPASWLRPQTTDHRTKVRPVTVPIRIYHRENNVNSYPRTEKMTITGKRDEKITKLHADPEKSVGFMM